MCWNARQGPDSEALAVLINHELFVGDAARGWEELNLVGSSKWRGGGGVSHIIGPHHHHLSWQYLDHCL